MLWPAFALAGEIQKKVANNSCIFSNPCYNTDEEIDEGAQVLTNDEPRELQLPGFCRFLSWSADTTGCAALFAVQPFADIIRDYTRHDGDEEINNTGVQIAHLLNAEGVGSTVSIFSVSGNVKYESRLREGSL